MGRLRHKPDDFLAYVKTAVARLKLDISNVSCIVIINYIMYHNSLHIMLAYVQVTDVEILDVLAEYQHKEVLLKAFLQVSHNNITYTSHYN